MQIRIILSIDDVNNRRSSNARPTPWRSGRTEAGSIFLCSGRRPNAAATDRSRRWAPDACTVSRAKPGSQVNRPIEQLLKIEARTADLLEHLGEEQSAAGQPLSSGSAVRPAPKPPAGCLEPCSRVPRIHRHGPRARRGRAPAAPRSAGASGASALKAMLGTEMLMKNMTSRRNESSRLTSARGRYPPGSPHRKAAQNDDNRRGLARVPSKRCHNSGGSARNPGSR